MIDEKKLIEKIEFSIKASNTQHDNYMSGLRNGMRYCLALITGKEPGFEECKQWIPVSERLPKPEGKNEWVKCDVTVIRSHWPTSSYDYCDSPYDEFYVTEAMYNVSQKIWNLSNEIQLNALIDIEDAPLNGDYVIAWQPLPEPYQGGREE